MKNVYEDGYDDIIDEKANSNATPKEIREFLDDYGSEYQSFRHSSRNRQDFKNLFIS